MTDTARGPATTGSPEAAEALTPTFGERVRRGHGWIWIAAGTVLTAVAVVLLSGQLSSMNTRPYDPRSPHPTGTKALVEVLRQEGIDIHLTSDPATPESAAPATTTLVVDELDRPLGPDEIDRITDAGYARVVFLAPTVMTLDALPVELSPAGTFGTGNGTALEAGDRCPTPLRDNAPELSRTGGAVYDVGDDPDAWGCYAAGGRDVLVGASAGGTEFVAFGAPDALTNGIVLEHANAALGLALLGSQPTLEWYTVGPLAPGEEPVAYIPPWLTPAILVLIAAGVATMVWRGRRFGALVFENLPVVVPASETMDGRARLYAKSRVQLRALDSIRMGAIGRLANVLGLPASTDPVEIADAVAAQTRRPRDEVRFVLLGAHPVTDAQLVDLSTRIRDLERDCRGSLRPDDHPTAERPQRDTKRT